jgi:hypothetical protein
VGANCTVTVQKEVPPAGTGVPVQVFPVMVNKLALGPVMVGVPMLSAFAVLLLVTFRGSDFVLPWTTFPKLRDAGMSRTSVAVPLSGRVAVVTFFGSGENVAVIVPESFQPVRRLQDQTQR